MKSKPDKSSAILRISCPDQIGIDAAVTRFVSENRGNIIDFDQHVDASQNVFFMRVEWECDSFAIARDDIATAFDPIARAFNMNWYLDFSDQRTRMAIFVSRQSHCLYDLLARSEADEWPVEIPVIISNHGDLKNAADRFGIDFHHIPVDRENKAEQERRQMDLLHGYDIDLIVLARYMQILTENFVNQYPSRIINIHHSFLPAFAGARPYHAAYSRGVKLIGATSHYVTADLDAGPIIDQDIIRVTHKDDPADLVRKGRDLEKIVLARAIGWHLHHKILVYNNKTVIFD